MSVGYQYMEYIGVTAQSKPCANCKVDKSLSDFYVRSGIDNPSEPGHYVSECKVCMKARSKDGRSFHPYQPRTASEKVAIDWLLVHQVSALPGKAISASNVDVVAWGCVWIEIKLARLASECGVMKYKFDTTPKQQERGFLADVVMLICDNHGQMTFHLFEANDPVFYIHDRVKTGFTFTPGAEKARKHSNNRVVMTQPMMDEAEDRYELIEAYRLKNFNPYHRIDTD